MVDIGSSSIRAGYAGDDAPKCIVPTSYGYSVDGATAAMEGIESNGETVPAASGSTSAKLHIGNNGPSLFRPGMEVRNPMQGGMSEPSCLGNVLRSLLNLW